MQTNTIRRVVLSLVSAFLLVGAGCASDKAQETGADMDEMLEEARADAEQYQEQAESLQQENEKLTTQLEEMQAKLEDVQLLAKTRRELLEDLESDLSELIDMDKLRVTTRRGLLVVQVPRDVLFASGKFELSDDGRETLRSVASTMNENLEDRRLLVVGHTDNVPISEKAVNFKNNWELSVKRGMAAMNVLIDSGVERSKLGAAGFGEHDPIASNDSEEGRQKNRRVEMVVVPDMSGVIESAQAAAETAEAETDQ